METGTGKVSFRISSCPRGHVSACTSWSPWRQLGSSSPSAWWRSLLPVFSSCHYRLSVRRETSSILFSPSQEQSVSNLYRISLAYISGNSHESVNAWIDNTLIDGNEKLLTLMTMVMTIEEVTMMAMESLSVLVWHRCDLEIRSRSKKGANARKVKQSPIMYLAYLWPWQFACKKLQR